jgi:hypothetical protein
MASLRGVAGFEELWQRRTAIEVDGETVDLMGIEDLVRAKKTQRDKDWPMIRRLVEQSYFESAGEAGPARVEFWLREMRTADLLIAVAAAYPEPAATICKERPATCAAMRGATEETRDLLEAEEREERRRDREYWDPLKRELEQLRLSRRTGGGDL